MYAILQHGGHQYRVAPGERLLVDRFDAEVGSSVNLGPVLFVADEGKKGSAADAGVMVTAKVVSHHRGEKLRVFKYKPKKRYRRTMGHRSFLTELEVTTIGTPAKGAKASKGADDGA